MVSGVAEGQLATVGHSICSSKRRDQDTTQPDYSIAADQRPKSNHNRMITGIGTPNSQSKIPRPIVSSSVLVQEYNSETIGLFRLASAPSDGRKSSVDGFGPAGFVCNGPALNPPINACGVQEVFWPGRLEWPEWHQGLSCQTCQSGRKCWSCGNGDLRPTFSLRRSNLGEEGYTHRSLQVGVAPGSP